MQTAERHPAARVVGELVIITAMLVLPWDRIIPAPAAAPVPVAHTQPLPSPVASPVSTTQVINVNGARGAVGVYPTGKPHGHNTTLVKVQDF